MPDIFALLKTANDAPTLKNRTLVLDRMEATFAQFVESFPGNQRFPAQLSAVRNAKYEIKSLSDRGDLSADRIKQVFATVKQDCRNAGATDVDLQHWGLG